MNNSLPAFGQLLSSSESLMLKMFLFLLLI